jgi:general secretion pathway protein K
MESKNDGIALIAVLWLIVLLTLLGTAVAALSVSHRRAAERYIETAQAESTADSAIRLVLLKLLRAAARNSSWPVNKEQHVRLLDATAEVVVEREETRLDLNTVGPELLFALFGANGWKEHDARSMAARILDWRDADDKPEEGGAEQNEYDEAGLPYGPRNGPFECTEELRQVMGSEQIGAELFDAFTVYTHTQAPMAAGAKPAVSRALLFANGQQLGGHRWLSPAQEQAPPAQPQIGVSLVGEVLRIRACVGLRNKALCRQAIVRLTGNLQEPQQVYAWQ